MMPACKYCIYFWDGVFYPQCRRYPPIPIREHKNSAYPETDKYSWCGEFKNREDETYEQNTR